LDCSWVIYTLTTMLRIVRLIVQYDILDGWIFSHTMDGLEDGLE